jgi:serine/threonine-protein kinase
VPGTDIFSVGAVLYHLLTGSKPFEGPTLQSLFYRIVTDMPKPLDEVRPGLPARLNAVVQRAMAKEAPRRFESALDMANAIIAVRAELSGNAYASTASLTASAVNVVESFAPKPVPVSTGKPAWKRLDVIAAAAAVVLVSIFALLKPKDAAVGPSTYSVADTASATVAQTDSISKPVVQPTAPVPVPESTTSRTPRTDTPAAPSAQQKKRDRANEIRAAEIRAARLREEAKKREKAAVKTQPKTATTTRTPQTQTQSQTTITLPPPPIVSTPLRDNPQRPVVTTPPPSPPVKAPDPVPDPKPDPRDEINGVVAAYARAIESRDIGAVRRAYPGISADQSRGFEQFFQSARNINVTFRVSGLDINGNSADARLVGTYQYTGSDGKAERQPVSFSASFRSDGGSWRLTAVR